jgi:hypothetical protein
MAQARAQDVVVLTSGQSVKGQVLRFDSTTFSVMVSNEVQDFAEDDVHSVFFGVEETTDATAPAGPSAAPHPAAPPPPETTPPAPEKPAPPAAKAPSPSTTKPQNYGAVSGSYTVSEVLSQSAQLDGKLIKLEFFKRGIIRDGQEQRYSVRLSDNQGEIEVPFGQEAYAWFDQLPEWNTYSDIGRRKARDYNVYGIVSVQSNTTTWLGTRQVPAVKLEPVGRKTGKGIKGIEYAW